MKPIKYTIQPKNPNAHLFSVSVEISPSHNEPVELTLPAWIPGSYMIRDFARNIISLKATECEQALKVEKTDKQTWQVTHNNRPFIVVYDVYAWDLSVRTAHLDQSHGFFNGTSVFLAISGAEPNPCEVNIKRPTGPQYQDWKIATGLKRAAQTNLFEPGLYLADNYLQLIDCPVEMGNFDHCQFESHGILHHMVFTGRHFGDLQRVSNDVQRLCEHHLSMFEIKPDIEEYWFMTYITDNGYGGLEHPNSTALICSRFDLPSANYPEKQDDGYITYLGLCSHEYFHTWNVKRIKPAEFIPYALAQESYTRQLWAYEGITSYYDDLSLVRTGLISIEKYLKLLSRTFSRVYSGKGRLKQTVSESSFDAWTKFYKQDENAPNAIVSYYTKGSMIALCVDLMIRQQTQQQKSLDDVMKLLWNKHGLTEVGTNEQDFVTIIDQVCQSNNVSAFLKQAIHSTDDLPMVSLLEQVGIAMTFRRPVNAADLCGVNTTNPYAPSLGILSRPNGVGITITHVLDDSAAQLAGLSAKDLLLAIDNIKVSAENLQTLLQQIPKGATVPVTCFREDSLLTMDLTIIEAEPYVAQLKLENEELAKHWLINQS